MEEQDMSELDEEALEEDPGFCGVCGKEYEVVRPGKSQPTCDCHLRCPCGRMKSHYAIGEHPTEPKAGGYLCPSCGMMGPCDEVLKKSLARVPEEEGDEHRARLLTYIKMGQVRLPVPFGHGFFFEPKRGTLFYSPWSMHALKMTWSMDSDFPIEIPDEIDLDKEMGLWSMIAPIIIVALDGHPEACKWGVVYEFATSMESRKSLAVKSQDVFHLELCHVVEQKKQALFRKFKEIRKDLTLAQLKGAFKALPWRIGTYSLPRCIALQSELSDSGGHTKIRY